MGRRVVVAYTCSCIKDADCDHESIPIESYAKNTFLQEAIPDDGTRFSLDRETLSDWIRIVAAEVGEVDEDETRSAKVIDL